MEYTCRNCGHSWNSGFFNNKVCRKCRGIPSQVWDLVKVVLRLAIPLAMVALIMNWVFPKAFRSVSATLVAAVDSRTFYAYGPEAYTESVLKGQVKGYYTLTQSRPAFAEIVDSAAIVKAKPGLVLARGQTFRLQALSRHGGDVWGAAEFYQGDTVKRMFVLLPRSWEQSVDPYDMAKTVAAYRSRYADFVRKRFQVTAVAAGGAAEKKFSEEHPDYFPVPDMGDSKTKYFAPKASQGAIDQVNAYFLDQLNIKRIVLQSEPDYKQPELKLPEEK
jgi:hypothetical protein